MAASTCVKCGGHSFELMENEPSGAKFKFYFVQCSSCGGVVGVLSVRHIPTMLDKLGTKLGVDLS
jgi:hypothetical protein